MRIRNSRRKAALVLGAFVASVLVPLIGSIGTADANPPKLPAAAADHVPVCGPAPTGYARCHAERLVRPGQGKPPRSTTTTTTSTSTSTTSTSTTTSTTTTTAPTTTTTLGSTACTDANAGYTPCDLASAYALDPAAGAGKTVAIVDAYDNPNAEADLATYRAAYGLPACTTANGCFRKVDQNGGTSYPAGDVGWGQEIALDLDMVSAVCRNCNILLVVANSNSFLDLFTAVDTAAALGADAISNSYGGNEFFSETAYEGHYNHPGVAITASSGDSGYGAQFPAASRYVTAVGGTKLVRDNSARGWSETAWSGAGSGCSKYVTKPAWQTDPGCARRTIADVSAVADPNTGVAVYDTYGSPGWMVFGGTSVASPIIASVYALAGNTGAVNYGSYPYSHTNALNDVTSGSNGNCAGSYLCTGSVGYDGPTGLGTPIGSAAF